ncbi:hypothetical protein F2Q70_00031001 [Brassica cretica]|uniref:SWIM-type domain-containing protein n=1 Tax=Brassica cretica TaxID=69181 RepID=A0A8S9FF33_BRACR|nr:hypothetical protein F2Q70_00031001 [Brassica cretica]
MTCDCGVYAMEKIPCSHAIAAGTSAGLHISTLVCPVYSKDFLFAGYSEKYIVVLDNKLRNTHAFLRMKSVVQEDRRNQDDNLGWSYPG